MSKRVTQLTELTSPAVDDLLPIVDTSTGTTKKITYRNLVNIPELGWTSAGETWVYASATTFTVAGVDVTEKYPVGTKIRLKQGGSYKYFYIVTRTFSTNTTITVTGGSDYSLANATITDNYFSYAVVATGFPSRFNYTPSWTNLTVGSGTVVAFFSMVGKRVLAVVRFTYGAGSAVGSTPQFTLPVAVGSNYLTSLPGDIIGDAQFNDSGSGYTGFVATYGSTTNAVLYATSAGGATTAFATVSSTVPFTFASTDFISGRAIYEAA